MSNPDNQLEILNRDTLEQQLDSVWRFVLDSGKLKVPASTRNFLQGWLGGEVVKVFTSRVGGKVTGELKALKVFLVMPDPFDGSKKHITECISIGDAPEFDEFVNNVKLGF